MLWHFYYSVCIELYWYPAPLLKLNTYIAQLYNVHTHHTILHTHVPHITQELYTQITHIAQLYTSIVDKSQILYIMCSIHTHE